MEMQEMQKHFPAAVVTRLHCASCIFQMLSFRASTSRIEELHDYFNPEVSLVLRQAPQLPERVKKPVVRKSGLSGQ